MLKQKISAEQKPKTILKDRRAYPANIAVGLLVYSHFDDTFLKELNINLSSVNTSLNKKRIDIGEEDALLIPGNRQTAFRRLEWLFDFEDYSGKEEALAVLASGIKDVPFEVPKQLVVGIAGIAIPGVTLGLISKKKKISFIARPELFKNKTEMAEAAVKAGHGLLKQALVSSGGQLEKLDPDIAEWFFGDRESEFLQGNREALDHAKKEIKDLNIPCEELEKSGQTALLAVSPALNDSYRDIRWRFDKL